MSEKNPVEKHLHRLYEGVRHSEELDDAVIARVKALREEEAAPRALVTRRVTLVGAAGCAVAAGLALGLPVLLGPDSGGNAFGLVIARAAEGGDAVAVSAGSDGLMPCDGTYGSYIRLSLNLSVTGGSVESVTYRVTDSPMATIDRPSIHEPMTEHAVVSLYTEAPDDYGDEMPPGEIPETVTIDPAASDAPPCLDVNGNVPYLTVNNRDAFWASDETIQLLGAWLDLESRPWGDTSEYAWQEGETDEEHIERVERLTEEAWAEYDALQPQIQAAREAYLESFHAHAATQESFEEWQRSLYVSGFVCAADALGEARLEATATFSDGSTQTRRYRISFVDGCEQVLSERFDALLALDDDFSQCLEEELPWHRYPTPTEEEIAADPRLSAPIFQIEDVTGA